MFCQERCRRDRYFYWGFKCLWYLLLIFAFKITNLLLVFFYYWMKYFCTYIFVSAVNCSSVTNHMWSANKSLHLVKMKNFIYCENPLKMTCFATVSQTNELISGNRNVIKPWSCAEDIQNKNETRYTCLWLTSPHDSNFVWLCCCVCACVCCTICTCSMRGSCGVL